MNGIAKMSSTNVHVSVEAAIGVWNQESETTAVTLDLSCGGVAATSNEIIMFLQLNQDAFIRQFTDGPTECGFLFGFKIHLLGDLPTGDVGIFVFFKDFQNVFFHKNIRVLRFQKPIIRSIQAAGKDCPHIYVIHILKKECRKYAIMKNAKTPGCKDNIFL